jgi:hypothetical protein
LAALLVVFSPIGQLVGFAVIPSSTVFGIAVIVVAYLSFAEAAKGFAHSDPT